MSITVFICFRPDQILNTTNGTGVGAELLSPPELPFHVLRRGSEGSLPWGTSTSVESGSDDEDFDGDIKDSTPADGGGASAGNGAGTDGASDASARRESKLTDLLEKKKKGDKKRRKPDKHGDNIMFIYSIILQS